MKRDEELLAQVPAEKPAAVEHLDQVRPFSYESWKSCAKRRHSTGE